MLEPAPLRTKAGALVFAGVTPVEEATPLVVKDERPTDVYGGGATELETTPAGETVGTAGGVLLDLAGPDGALVGYLSRGSVNVLAVKGFFLRELTYLGGEVSVAVTGQMVV